MSEREIAPVWKTFAQKGYSAALGAATLFDVLFPRSAELSVFYGGARVGDVGGPLVKVQRLRKRFPERRLGYSVVYSLSNAPYLPPVALRQIQRRLIPIIHNQNGVFHPGWYRGDWRGQNARMAHAYHLADHVFYQSAFCRDAADYFLGPRQGSGEILHNAVDTQHFSPCPDAAAEKALGEGSPFTFLVTGKIGNPLYYRLDSTIRGLAEARRNGLDAVLRIAGWVGIEALSQARDLAQAEGIAPQVEFVGPYTQKQAPEVYRQADAYVITKHNDPCPNTVLEALACGLPVIYSASGGVPELVGDQAGIALEVPRGFDGPHAPDAAALAAAMEGVAKARPAMAAAARQRAVERFDINDWLDRHEQVFLALLEGRTP